MDSKLLPLSSKYYRTVIEITSGPLEGMDITLSKNTGNPSDRELENWDLTRSDWDNNIQIKDMWGGASPCHSMIDCGNHCESQEVYLLAKHLVECLNNYET